MAALCKDVPRVTQGDKQYCISGLRLTGDLGVLQGATAKLKSEGWGTSLGKLPTGEVVGAVSAKGQSLTALRMVAERLQRGEFGALNMSVTAVPDSEEP